MSIIVDVSSGSAQGVYLNESSNQRTQGERLKMAAEDGDIEKLYELIAEDQNILERFDQLSFCETPLHVAAKTGHSHFAMELMTLKPSFALKLDVSGFSPIHLALQNNHTRTVRGFVAIDKSLVSIKGKGRTTPLHHVARIGDADLLSEFLCACPSSIEDLTIRRETVVHVAVKNHQIEVVKVLLGWLKRENREEILDWKDEDGNTVFHIAASINQTEVMTLLRKTVKVEAMNLHGKTAKEILQAYKSPIFPKASRFLRGVTKRLHCGSTMTLAEYLSKPLSFIEKQNKLLGLNGFSKPRHTTSDFRNGILVVAVLIITATYQAVLTPPGGYFQENTDTHAQGRMVMGSEGAIYFYTVNIIAFFSALHVILILIIGLPMWKIIYGAISALGIANIATFINTFPQYVGPDNSRRTIEFFIGVSFILAYIVAVVFVILAPIVLSCINKHRRNRVDFPVKYFNSRIS